MSGERERIATIRAYLRERFSDPPIEEEWDFARDVLVLRFPAPGEDGRTFLLEVASDLLDTATPDEIRTRLDRWNADGALREHFRVLLTSKGLEPLPWKQLAREVDRVEEALEETFPASDAPGR